MATLTFDVACDDLTSEFICYDLMAIVNRGVLRVGDWILSVFLNNEWLAVRTLPELNYRTQRWAKVKIMIERRGQRLIDMFPTNADLMALNDGPDRREDMKRVLQRIRIQCLGPERPEDLENHERELHRRDMRISTLEAENERLHEIISNLRAQIANNMNMAVADQPAEHPIEMDP